MTNAIITIIFAIFMNGYLTRLYYEISEETYIVCTNKYIEEVKNGNMTNVRKCLYENKTYVTLGTLLHKDGSLLLKDVNFDESTHR